MKITLKEIALLTNAEIVGDEGLSISNVARIQDAGKDDLTFLYLGPYEKYFSTTLASAIFVDKNFKRIRNDITYLVVEEPNKAFFTVIIKYFKPVFDLRNIDKTSSIDPSSILDENVSIGKNVVISPNCKIGKNVKIYHNSVLHDNVQIGEDSIIFSNVTIRENCKIGKRVIIHPGAVIGSDGFGFIPDDKGVYNKIPQIGNVIIEDDVEIGSNVTIDRAALGATLIKRGTKIDNLVQVAHNVTIGENTVISAQTGISGSTKIGNNCMIAGQVGFINHIEIADKTIIIAQSGVTKSITQPGTYMGSPVKPVKESMRLEAHIRNLNEYATRIKLLEDKCRVLESKINLSKD
jgi:UDP-3-O-[3-hydroxymyristoyl] glucosamine N-acyltransferase